MSWNIAFIGTSAAIETAIDKHAATLEGDSLQEYKEAMPALLILAKSNYNSHYPNALFRLQANGHRHKSEKSDYGSLYITFEQLPGELV